MATTKTPKKGNDGLDFEDSLWRAADKLRGTMDASEYKHVILGLIFLKYISDAFEARYAELEAEGLDPTEEDEYVAENIFWVPEDARWALLKNAARQPHIGKLVDDAMRAIEDYPENKSLKGVLPKDYARQALNKQTLGEIIDLISTIGMGDADARSRDILGRVYEYFLGRFASAEGKAGGEFYTPRSVVQLLVEMLEPRRNQRVFDPCCGSGGMFVQSEKFIKEHGGKIGDIAIYGQESNNTTWRLAKMNMAVRGISADIRWNSNGSFHEDEFRDKKAHVIMANPPFNDSDWGGDRLKEDVRWKYGTPPVSNSNYAWLQHIVHHLTPDGMAGVVLANGSMSSGASGEGDIRRAMVDGDIVDCMVALPGQLFYTTQIPVCLWFLARNKAKNGFRERTNETLFMDARKLGHLVDRTRREFSPEDIQRIAHTYHTWRTEDGGYEDTAGFCKAASRDEIAGHGYVLTPGRYVGAEDAEDDGIPFEEKFAALKTTLEAQFSESEALTGTIRRALESVSPKSVNHGTVPKQ